MKIGLFRCQINTLDGVFCSILVTVSRKSKLKVYKQMPNMQHLAVGDEYILLCALLTSVREYSWHCQR